MTVSQQMSLGSLESDILRHSFWKSPYLLWQNEYPEELVPQMWAGGFMSPIATLSQCPYLHVAHNLSFCAFVEESHTGLSNISGSSLTVSGLGKHV